MAQTTTTTTAQTITDALERLEAAVALLQEEPLDVDGYALVHAHISRSRRSVEGLLIDAIRASEEPVAIHAVARRADLAHSTIYRKLNS